VTTQIDQNVMVMQIIECAVKHGLAALLTEKPFQGVNGSGKHNNWSIGTDNGTNLLNVLQLAEKSGSGEIFPVIMAAILAAYDDYGDLFRMAIAVPGNDFRLGACEAPPAILSTFLGDDMTSFLESYMAGGAAAYIPSSQSLHIGCSAVPPITTPAQDRNRTSPFPYGGHRFEFRAVGSSQNVSLVNTILNTTCAKYFKEFSEQIEAGAKARDVATAALKKHWKVVFNGNGYDADNQAMLTQRGVTRIDSAVDAMVRYTDPRNMALFEEMHVLSPQECVARQAVSLDHYIGTVEMEARCMVDMIKQHILPQARECELDVHVQGLEDAVRMLTEALAEIHNTGDNTQRAALSRVVRLQTMTTVRVLCDEVEGLVPEEMWTIATYKELLFIDQHVAAKAPVHDVLSASSHGRRDPLTSSSHGRRGTDSLSSSLHGTRLSGPAGAAMAKMLNNMSA